MNEAAEAAGLAAGDSLADARARAGFLQVHAVEAAADDTALRRLALWATRYTPTASPWGEENGADGFFLDVEGAAHLFGGEEQLLADLSSRLENNFGLPARLAVAATPGAAWALSHFHAERACVLPSGDEAKALAALPVDALRLAPETRTTLRRLGFKTIGSLLDKPRAPFAARFPSGLLRRVDQALGRIDEPLVPIVAPPVYHCLRYLIEPILTQEAIVALASRLMGTLVRVLARDDAGARTLRLCLYRVDGAVAAIDIGLTLPTRDVSHVARLIELKLEALAATEDAGFGFEAVGLAVTCAEPMTARQTDLTSAIEDGGDRTERCAALIDALRQRLGPDSVRGFEPVPSHIPERAEALIDALRQRLGPGSVRAFEPVPSHIPERAEALMAVNGKTAVWPAAEPTRPLLLLPHAEPAEEVMALVPEGPPRRFRWRGVTYEVKRSQGPERIASEWWRSCSDQKPEPTRDYYLVEDSGGLRFWLFRNGLYGRETADAHWFVHGLFA